MRFWAAILSTHAWSLEAPTTTARLGDVLDAFPAAKMRKYGASIVAAVSAFLDGRPAPPLNL